MTLINSSNLVLLLLAISALMVSTRKFVDAREVPTGIPYPGHNLAARINADDGGAGMVECWNALYELRSCTNEIILFFMDGDMYLGLECCRAIRIITRDCWPSMLTSVGFTAEEGDILRGYCDASSSAAPRISHVSMLTPVQPPYISGPSTSAVLVE
ncbi:egg cell-secreted protein 1.2-like [Papaver somniferum]|uniref:egg cell-secreted protein 1.2-like n=1 Tax=Papaver somniferum TaxID=3469 RepID=UPI000E6FA311|nr:egg cell-secreted protein 1.2-like [Papaver somniferum]